MANKSKPITIRFDLDKVDFFKQREKIKTNQEVINWFLNDYWWKHKLPIPNSKEAPPLELKVYDAEKIEHLTHDEPPIFQQPKGNISTITGLPPKLTFLDSLMDELKNATQVTQVEEIMRKSKSEPLSQRERVLLEGKAKEVSREMFTD